MSQSALQWADGKCGLYVWDLTSGLLCSCGGIAVIPAQTLNMTQMCWWLKMNLVAVNHCRSLVSAAGRHFKTLCSWWLILTMGGHVKDLHLSPLPHLPLCFLSCAFPYLLYFPVLHTLSLTDSQSSSSSCSIALHESQWITCSWKYRHIKVLFMAKST